MKKILGLMAILACFAAVNAGRVVAPTMVTGSIAWEYLDSATNIYTPGGRDSLVGVDTQSLFVKKPYTPGCVYAVLTKDSVGAADTVAIEYVTYINKNGTDVEVMTGVCDTLLPRAALGSFYALSNVPVGQTAWGNKFSIRAVGWIAALKAKVRRAYLLVGRPVAGEYSVPAPMPK